MIRPYSLRLKDPHRHQDVYARAAAWIEEHDSNIVALGNWLSIFDHTLYISDISFKHDEDRLIFVLTFPELV